MAALANRMALVTGATSGIGGATAKLFARGGAALVSSGSREALFPVSGTSGFTNGISLLADGGVSICKT